MTIHGKTSLNKTAQRLAKILGLPVGAIALLTPKKVHAKGTLTLAALRKAWGPMDVLETKERKHKVHSKASIKAARSIVAAASGIPEAAVTILNPKGHRVHKDTNVKHARKVWAK